MRIGCGADDLHAGEPASHPIGHLTGRPIVFQTDRAALFTRARLRSRRRRTPCASSGRIEFLEGLSPSWSPDGTQIAYIEPTTGTVQIITVAGRSQATTIDVGGTASSSGLGSAGHRGLRACPQGGGDSSLVHDRSRRWLGRAAPRRDRVTSSTLSLSPDGMFVAFVGNADGQQDIYVMRLADGRRWRITDDDRQDLSPVWLPGS